MKTGIARGITLSAIAALIFAPVSATAGTRASDTSARYVASANAEPGVERDDDDDRAGLIWFDLHAFLIGSAVIGILVAMAIDEGERASFEIDEGERRRQFQSNGAN